MVMSFKYVRSVFVFAVIFTILFGTIEFSRTGQSPITSIILTFIGGLFLGFVVGYIASQLPFRNSIRIAVLWLALFIIQYLSNSVEYYFYSTVAVSSILSELAEGLVATFIEAAFLGLLFVPVKIDRTLRVEMKKFFGQRSGSSWFWRIVVASLLYIPIYLTFGALVSPFVVPYYTDPSLGLDLAIPGFDVILPLQFIRGLIYVLVLLPFIATLRIGRKHLFTVITLLLFIPGAFLPLITEQVWPVPLRIIHGIEILGDYIVFAAVIVRLLKKKE